MTVATLIKGADAKLDPDAVLARAPTALLGVDDNAGAVLKELGISTVYDLALSTLFANARAVADAAADPMSAAARYGGLPTGVLSDAAAGTPVADLGKASLGALKALADGLAAKAEAALGVATVRDLAMWPPYAAAQAVLADAFGTSQGAAVVEDPAADLVPRNGEYPTERVYYSTLLLDAIAGKKPATDLSGAGPLDLTSLDERYGFKQPAEGAIVTYSQSWYVQGLALGHLLHSLALAPGEATRVAMLDWSRRTAGTRDESGSESEQLANTTAHTRALNEVTSAVASEAQAGFSRAASTSTASQSGTASGDVVFKPKEGAPAIGLEGTSTGFATNTTNASSFAVSAGRRDVNAFMAQNVSDATNQAAHAARARRATVVQEVSEDEKATASTRIVANYNHMHALTVSYYEVMQLYRVEVALERIERCLFIPMKLIDFSTKPSLTPQQRFALADRALDERIARALRSRHDIVTAIFKPKGSVTDPAQKNGFKPVLPKEDELHGVFGEAAQIIGSDGLSLPKQTIVSTATVVGAGKGDQVLVGMRDGAVKPYDVADGRVAFSGLELEQVASMEYRPATKTQKDAAISIGLGHAMSAAMGKGVSVTVSLDAGAAGSGVKILDADAGPSSTEAELTALHLQRFSLYYNQALWQTLAASDIALLLSPYTYRGRALLELVDPTPVAVVGNFLVFRMPVEPDEGDKASQPAKEWAKWLDDHQFLADGSRALRTGPISRQLVPLPSGGVFAEAVLGRSNAAEKLDMTRFWNWQDSPPPLVPPEIEPLSTASRADAPDLQPGQFPSPMVNIVAPTSVPDPQGMAAILDAVSNGNMFRDMSGLAATIGLAQAGMQAASHGAEAGAAQAGTNMKTAADLAAKLAELAVSAYTGKPVAGVGGGGGNGPAKNNISTAGAGVNYGEELDRRQTAQARSGGSSNGAEPGEISQSPTEIGMSRAEEAWRSSAGLGTASRSDGGEEAGVGGSGGAGIGGALTNLIGLLAHQTGQSGGAEAKLLCPRSASGPWHIRRIVANLKDIGDFVADGAHEKNVVVHSLGILAHGDAGGRLTVGSDTVEVSSLPAYESVFDRLNHLLDANGEVILFGCISGADAAGSALLKQISKLLPGRDIVGFNSLNHLNPVPRNGSKCFDPDIMTMGYDVVDPKTGAKTHYPIQDQVSVQAFINTFPGKSPYYEKASRDAKAAKIARDGKIVRWPPSEAAKKPGGG